MDGFLGSIFFVNIIVVLILSSFLVAIVGSVLQMGRLFPLAGSISHTILAGVGLATWLGFNLWGGAILVAVLACLVLAFVNVYNERQIEVASNILWGGGMALGIMFTSFSTGYQQNLANFLFGNIVLVSFADTYIIFGMNIFIILMVATFYRQFLLVWFSSIFAKTQRVNQFFIWFISIFIISLGIISLVKTMGIALALVLLSVPQHIARLLYYKVWFIGFMGFILSLFSMFLGLFISYYWNVPAGASIALVCLSLYILPITKKILG